MITLSRVLLFISNPSRISLLLSGANDRFLEFSKSKSFSIILDFSFGKPIPVISISGILCAPDFRLDVSTGSLCLRFSGDKLLVRVLEQISLFSFSSMGCRDELFPIRENVFISARQKIKRVVL